MASQKLILRKSATNKSGKAPLRLRPRRDSDVDNPIGGVRNVIPGKGEY